MKKAFLALATLAMIFATSCKKENTNAPEEPTVFNGDQFTCVIDPSANPQNAPRIEDGMSQMARIDENNIVWWQINDQIAYHGECTTDGKIDWYTLNCNSTPDNGGAAYFTAEEERHFGQGTHEAYYPASLHTTNGLKLPQTQEINPNRNASHLPMYATGSGAHYLTFHNICAVLKITVPTLPSNCFKIVVTNNDDPFCGEFYVDDNKAIIIRNDEIGENEKHVDVVKTNNSAFTAGEVVYVALPEGDYHNVSIQFYGKDTDGNDDLIFGSIIPDMTVHTNCIYPVTVQYHPEFCITALENETITFQKIGDGAPSISLQYCTSSNYGNWAEFISTTEGEDPTQATAPLSKGEKLYLKATSTNATFANASMNRHIFYANGKYAVSGKISYLLDQNGDEPTTLAAHTFRHMFANRGTAASNGANVIDAGNLILLSKTSTSCYYELFGACHSLSAAPILPARTLANNCYNQIFSNTAVKSVIMRATSGFDVVGNGFESWIKSGNADNTIHTTSAAETWFNGNTTYKYGWTVVDDQQ